MKLGTLLAAGKSLMKGQAQVSYRENRQVYLPKFGPAKNPFKPETPQSAAETSDPAPAAPRPTRADQETAVTGAMRQSAGPAHELPAVPAIAEKKKTNWTGKLNPVLIFSRARARGGDKPPVKAAKTQKPAATQTELSLDSVKVLHNDLSDVDVEIVPMKSRSAPAELQPPKKSWEFLGERLLRIEAS
jgi:hypothetical protein